MPLEQGLLPLEGQQHLGVPALSPWGVGSLGSWSGMSPGRAGMAADGRKYLLLRRFPGQSEQEGECLEGGRGRVRQEEPPRDTRAIVP